MGLADLQVAPRADREVRVAAGDLVVADDTGLCFIPRDVAPVTGKWRIETVEINGPG